MEGTGGLFEDVGAEVGRSAGYGSIENYLHLEDEGIDCHVKYLGPDRDLKGTRYRDDADQAACVTGQGSNKSRAPGWVVTEYSARDIVLL